ncbi:MAG: hypothetical protein Q9M23_02155 [Mariprofundaceae bacterium]|nr:hypothetical protein [Mariprofundaceae bacterium]
MMLGAGRVLLLLSVLSVLVIGRVGLSMWGNQPSDDVIGLAQAAAQQENTQQASQAEPEAESTATSGISMHAIPEAEALPYTPDDVAISKAERETLLALRTQRDELNARQESIEERQKAIEEGEKKLSERIADLENLEARIKDMLAQEQSINTKKIKRLTAVYEGMKAVKAAPVLAQMDLQTVVRMFSRMDEKQVGKILSFLPPETAVTISQALTDRISEIQ